MLENGSPLLVIDTMCRYYSTDQQQQQQTKDETRFRPVPGQTQARPDTKEDVIGLYISYMRSVVVLMIWSLVAAGLQPHHRIGRRRGWWWWSSWVYAGEHLASLEPQVINTWEFYYNCNFNWKMNSSCSPNVVLILLWVYMYSTTQSQPDPDDSQDVSVWANVIFMDFLWIQIANE